MATAARETVTTLPADIPLQRDETPAAGAGAWITPLWIVGALGLLGWIVVKSRRASARQLATSDTNGGASRTTAWIEQLLHARGGVPLGRQAERPRVLGTQRLTPRHSLHVVQWRGEDWLLACSDAGVSVVTQKPSDASVEGGAS